MLFEEIVIRLESWQSVHINSGQNELRHDQDVVLSEWRAVPGWVDHFPVVLHNAWLHSQQTCKAALFESSQVNTIRLRAFRENYKLVEAGVFLAQLLTMADRIEHLLPLRR